MNHSTSYCGTRWHTLQRFITHNSVRLATTAIFETTGAILNALIILVFARKSTLTSSNLLFISLAISDGLVHVIGFPRLWMGISRYVRSTLDVALYTNEERIFDHYFYTLQTIFYHISLYQTMVLAVWRYIAITHPLKERILCNLKITIVSIILIHALCVLCYLPELLGLNIFLMPNTTTEDGAEKQTRGEFHSYLTSARNFLKTYNDLIYIVVLKTIPCTVVAICTLRFVHVLQKSKKRRKTMIANFNGDLLEKEKEMNRTTKMVLGITTFCLVTNILMAIGRILVIIHGDEFRKDCFPGVKNILNLLALIYLTIPFVVYYVISRQFRYDFKSLIDSVKCVWRISFSITRSKKSFSLETCTNSTDCSASISNGSFISIKIID